VEMRNKRKKKGEKKEWGKSNLEKFIKMEESVIKD
jgi:hypothetical protein